MSRLSEYGKEKVIWTRKMNLKLVKFIESRPNIWDPRHPKYTSIDLRDQTYAKFASKYDNAFSGQAVKDRWTNIRSTFATHVRKIRAGRLKNKEYKVNWHLWEACQFLMRFYNNKGSDAFTKEEKDDDVDSNSKADLASDEEILNYNNSSFTNCTTIAEHILQVFKGVQNDAFGLENTKHGKIGELVTQKLSDMNSFQAATVSKKIMDVLLLYDEHNPENPNNTKLQMDL